MKIITSLTTSDNVLMEQYDDSRYLKLLACGIQDLRDVPYTFNCIRRTDECKNYMLQIVISGHGFHTINETTHVLKAGQCILYTPGEPQHIIHYGSDNAVVLWLHFSGYGAAEVVTDLKLGSIHTLCSTSGLKTRLLQMAREIRSLMPDNDYLCQGYLLQFLVTLSRNFKENSSHSHHADKIAPALNHMMAEYAAQELTNSDYAQMCYMSESRFSHIFKEFTGTTPNKFIEQKRIEAAKDLLLSSALSISEVAFAVGYKDPYYFSRVFQKNVGVSPSVFLKQHKSNS